MGTLVIGDGFPSMAIEDQHAVGLINVIPMC